MTLLASIIGIVSSVLVWGLLIYILIQILIQFEIIPKHNQPARQLWAMLHRLYNPLLQPLRKRLPVLGGFDLSPLVLLVLIRVATYGLLWLL